ncbi:hypothetical protein ACAF76_002530 [Brevibacillus sp. TJ4]|uniref:hypothetical protein n=1 Tax=Brevibacillus sp. TJ4 TaxID=3234853 RepID=UPI0037D02AFB
MSYQAKLDWAYDTPVTEDNINRWEQGILDAHLELEALKPRMAEAETRIKALENALTNDFRDNRFVINFATLEGLRVSQGWYDEVNGRLVIK